MRADLRRPEEVRRAFAEARERFGPADVLVNNAGAGAYKPFLEQDEDEIVATVELNLTALMLCARAVLPDMLERGRGLIVDVGSDLSRRYLPNMAPYTASKWGVLGFSGSLLREVKESGVKVCAVLPGAIATSFGGGGTPEVPEDGSALGPEDVAAAIVSLLDQPERAIVDELNRGGVRVELAFTCCVICLRDLAAADPDELIAQWMREANEDDETADLIGSIGTGESWWRLISRRWYRRKAREQHKLADEWR